jgi:uncharacterized RDD family membrane protein YckC
MSRRQPAEEGLLFDLPLDRTPADARVAEDAEQPALPLAEEQVPQPPEEPAFDSRDDEPLPVDAPPAGARRPTTPPAGVTLRQRAAAGVADLGACAAVMVVLLVALLAQGVRPALSDWPAGALFLLTFSFLYAVLPLAFWGRTPGMALVGLRTSSPDGRPLTFRQAVLKWLGSVLTVALIGLPLLLALGGRSLSDLISGSTTRRLNHQP